MTEYFTEDYWHQLADRLNQHDGFQDKASDLDTSLLFVAEDKDRAFLMDVDHGKVTAEPASADADAEFAFKGDYDAWVSNHRDGTGLQRLVMTGKLTFEGSMGKIMGLQSQLGFVTDEAREIDAEY